MGIHVRNKGHCANHKQTLTSHYGTDHNNFALIRIFTAQQLNIQPKVWSTCNQIEGTKNYLVTVNDVDEDERRKVAVWNGDRPSSCLTGSAFNDIKLCPRNGRLVAGRKPDFYRGPFNWYDLQMHCLWDSYLHRVGTHIAVLLPHLLDHVVSLCRWEQYPLFGECLRKIQGLLREISADTRVLRRPAAGNSTAWSV